MGRPLNIALYSPYMGATYGGGEKYLTLASAALRDAFPHHRVELVGAVPIDAPRYGSMFGVDLTGIGLAATNARVTAVHRLLNRLGPLRPLRNLVLARQARRFGARYDVFIPMVYEIPVHSRARASVMLCQFPYPTPGPELTSYESIVCQSEYVRHWVREYWGRDARVVNPPVDVPAEAPSFDRKQPMILSVGRFIAAGHRKRQEVMVEAFKSLCDAGLTGWELHLAGSTHHDAVHAGYVDSVLEAARGYPIHFHLDAPYAELQDLYGRASIYWHAAGFGGDPDPASAEHFGMTTAEAMAYCAVPLVFDRGGQREIVQQGINGFVWTDLEGLSACTLRLVRDRALRGKLAGAARQSVLRLGRDRFASEIVAAIAPVVERVAAEAPAA